MEKISIIFIGFGLIALYVFKILWGVLYDSVSVLVLIKIRYRIIWWFIIIDYLVLCALACLPAFAVMMRSGPLSLSWLVLACSMVVY